MLYNRFLLALIVFGILAAIPSAVLPQGRYIRITANRVNIRAGPSTSSVIVAKARKDDVFELHGMEGAWYKTRLFSMKWRYIHKSLAEPDFYVASIPDRTSTRRGLFRALLQAENRAEAKADQRYPLEDRSGRPIPGNMKRNMDYMRLLDDRYKLEVIHKFNVQPPIHNIIISQGVKYNW